MFRYIIILTLKNCKYKRLDFTNKFFLQKYFKYRIQK